MTTGAAVFAIRPAQAWRRGGLIVAMLAAGVLLIWAWRLAEPGQLLVAGSAILLLMPVIVAAARLGASEGRLLCEAGVWSFEPVVPGAGRFAGELAVSVDLGDWLLLQFRADGARWPSNRRWLALSRRDMPADWQAFRRAVYSPRLSPAGRSAQAPADPPA